MLPVFPARLRAWYVHISHSYEPVLESAVVHVIMHYHKRLLTKCSNAWRVRRLRHLQHGKYYCTALVVQLCTIVGLQIGQLDGILQCFETVDWLTGRAPGRAV